MLLIPSFQITIINYNYIIMKTLSDNSIVSSRTYHYLLDYLEYYPKMLYSMFGKFKLCDLNIKEYNKIFKKATNSDKIVLKIKCNKNEYIN